MKEELSDLLLSFLLLRDTDLNQLQKERPKLQHSLQLLHPVVIKNYVVFLSFKDEQFSEKTNEYEDHYFQVQDIYQYDYGDFSDTSEKSDLNILDINEDISENLVDSGGYNFFLIFYLASTGLTMKKIFMSVERFCKIDLLNLL